MSKYFFSFRFCANHCIHVLFPVICTIPPPSTDTHMDTHIHTVAPSPSR